MERLGKKKSFAINGDALRAWALLFAAAGVVGRGVMQNHLLGIGQVSAQQLLEAISASDEAMVMATLSLILQAVETCAVPVFALMLVQGVQHTGDFKAYFLRVATLALLCEIPYNLAMGAKLLALESRNPVFGLVLCMVLISFYRYYAAEKFSNTLIKLAVTAAAVVWCEMLRIDFGSALVIVTAVLWYFRTKPLYRNFAGATAAIVCSVMSPFFMASPMAFMVIHFYNDEKSTNSRKLNYLAYPVILTVAAVVGLFL